MRTDKIDRLISALGNLNRTEAVGQIKRDNTNNLKTDTSYKTDDDAVDIAPSLRSAGANATEDTQRQAKIARISSQIQQGVYRPSSEAISVALIKELGI